LLVKESRDDACLPSQECSKSSVTRAGVHNHLDSGDCHGELWRVDPDGERNGHTERKRSINGGAESPVDTAVHKRRSACHLGVPDQQPNWQHTNWYGCGDHC
jgi:hypothetical protein